MNKHTSKAINESLLIFTFQCQRVTREKLIPALKASGGSSNVVNLYRFIVET